MSSFLSYWDPDEVDNTHPQTQEQAFGNSLLKKGQTSYYVKNVQIALDNRGYNVGTIDGIFGTNTYNAVVQFQQYAGLDDDGIVGPDTKEALWLATYYYLTEHGVMSL